VPAFQLTPAGDPRNELRPLRAELRAGRVAAGSPGPGAADLRVSWDRRLPAGDPAVPVVRIELGPVQRDLHLVELTDVDLESGPLAVGDRLELVDEGGYKRALANGLDVDEVTGAYNEQRAARARRR
jgi:hypothetical protein